MTVLCVIITNVTLMNSSWYRIAVKFLTRPHIIRITEMCASVRRYNNNNKPRQETLF